MRALLRELQSSRSLATPPPHLKVNVQVARSNIKRFCSMPLLPDTFKCRTRPEPGQNDGFMLWCTFPDVECQTELKLYAFYLVSCILPRPLYFNPQERFRKLARARHDQWSREKERHNESKRAAGNSRRAASKTLETFEIMLVLVQIARRGQCAARTWEFIKSQKLVSPLDHFPIEVWTRPTCFNSTGRILTPGYGKLKGTKTWIEQP